MQMKQRLKSLDFLEWTVGLKVIESVIKVLENMKER